MEIIKRNKYTFSQGNILKYMHRAGKKPGEEKKDILKIMDYAMFLAYENGVEIEEQEIHNLINYRIDWINQRNRS